MARMKLPEQWVVETAEAAKRELSLLLSIQFPVGVLIVAGMMFWMGSYEAVVVGCFIGAMVLLFGLPLALIGFATLDHKTRRKTVPFTVLSLLLFSCVSWFCV